MYYCLDDLLAMEHHKGCPDVAQQWQDPWVKETQLRDGGGQGSYASQERVPQRRDLHRELQKSVCRYVNEF